MPRMTIEKFIEDQKNRIKNFDERIRNGPYLSYSDGKFVLLLPNFEFVCSQGTIEGDGFFMLYRTANGLSYQLTHEPDPTIPLSLYFDPGEYDLPTDLPDQQYKLIVWNEIGPSESRYCHLKTVNVLPCVDSKY